MRDVIARGQEDTHSRGIFRTSRGGQVNLTRIFLFTNTTRPSIVDVYVEEMKHVKHLISYMPVRNVLAAIFKNKNSSAFAGVTYVFRVPRLP